MSTELQLALFALAGLGLGVVTTYWVMRSGQPLGSEPDAAPDAAPQQAGPGSDGDGLAPTGEIGQQAGAVLELLQSASVVLRRSGALVHASDGALAYGIVTSGELVRGPLRDLFDAVVASGEIRDAEVEVSRARFGQRTRVLAVRAAPFGTGLVLLLAEDRTDAHRVEEVRRDFVVNVSHELKTPIGALSLLAETIEQAADDPETVRRFVGRIQTEAGRLATLVAEILELSRLQFAGSLATAHAVELDAVIAEAVDRARTRAAARNIAIEVGGARGAEVFGGHDLLVTAVRNLLDNAVAYSEPGTRVAVGVEVHDGVVELAVVDQGIGIAADALPRLFERFYRVDPARSRDTGGTGLGLSIVKHVVAEHGGDIAVWSKPGQGSTFTIRLPLLVNENEDTAADASPSADHPAGLPEQGVR